MRFRRPSIAAAGAAAALAAAAVLHLTGGTAAQAQADPAPSGFLAIVSSVTGGADGGDFVQGPQRLVVVRPDGTQTVLHTVHPDPTTAVGAMQLLDVSADGRTALVQDLGRRLSELYTVDTTSGQVTHRLPGVSRLLGALLEPDGRGVLEIRQSATGYRDQLARTTWDGQVTARTWVRTSSTWITSAGDVLVPTTGQSRHALRLFDGSTGALDRTIGTGGRDCHPVRSIGATQVLLGCTTGDDLAGGTLFLLDPTVGTLVPVTRPHPSDQRFYGDIDARVTRDGVFVQEAGPCGWSWFTRQRADGTLVVQKVRGAVGEVDLVGRLGRRPVILDTTSCDTTGTQREVLATYDVRTHRQHVLHSWSAGHQVGPVVPLGERRVSF
ncbi:MAG TPA: hypothetical protein VJ872_11160 [Nocardioides sp.]|nr:hypothetical protein [Nocardioides sp.]